MMSQGFGKGVISLKVRYNRRILLSAIMLDRNYHHAINNHQKELHFADLFTQHRYQLPIKIVKTSRKYDTNFDAVYISWLEIKNNQMYAHLDSINETEELYGMIVNYAMVMGRFFTKSEVEEIAATAYGLAKINSYLGHQYKIRDAQQKTFKQKQAKIDRQRVIKHKHLMQIVNNDQCKILKSLIHHYLNRSHHDMEFMKKIIPDYQNDIRTLSSILKPGLRYNALSKNCTNVAIFIYLSEYESIKSRLTKSQNKQAVKLFNGLDKRGNIDKLFS